jgi:hypothetical protein
MGEKGGCAMTGGVWLWVRRESAGRASRKDPLVLVEVEYVPVGELVRFHAGVASIPDGYSGRRWPPGWPEAVAACDRLRLALSAYANQDRRFPAPWAPADPTEGTDRGGDR